MGFLTIDDADTIYTYSSSLKIYFHAVDDQDFHQLCRIISVLERSLGEFADDEYWSKFIGLMKRYRFHMIAAPLPFNWQDSRYPDFKETITRCKSICSRIHPQFVRECELLFKLYCDINDSTRNPLLDKFIEVCNNVSLGSSIAILVKENRLVTEVEKIIWSHSIINKRNIDVITPNKIDLPQFYDHIFVLGAIRWFPEYLFTSPRSSNIHILSYEWFIGRLRLESVFEKSISGFRQEKMPYFIDEMPNVRINNDVEEDLDHMLLLPKIDVNKLARRISQSHVDNDGLKEIVQARFLVLSNENCVFIDASESSKVLVIDLNAYEYEDENIADNQVQRLSNDKLTPGMFILLRTGGSGDYIIPIADKLMGPVLTQKVRQSQKNWKGRLRNIVSQRGIFQTALDLIDLGSKKANEINVRNWMLSTIRPNDPDDFRAILRLVDLEENFDTYWENANIILRNHRKAGHYIREELLSVVRTSNLTQLLKYGQMEFVLPKADGGSFTAFQIEQISPDIVEIPFSRLNEVFPLE